MRKVQVFIPERLQLNQTLSEESKSQANEGSDDDPEISTQRRTKRYPRSCLGKNIDFWITLDTTFAELCVDATRFYRKQRSEQNYSSQVENHNRTIIENEIDEENENAIKNNSAKFLLEDECGQIWPDKGRVFFHLAALPCEGMRVIYLGLQSIQKRSMAYRSASVSALSSPTSPWSLERTAAGLMNFSPVRLRRASTDTSDYHINKKYSDSKEIPDNRKNKRYQESVKKINRKKMVQTQFQELLHEELWRIFSYYCLKGNLHQPEHMSFNQLARLFDDCELLKIIPNSKLELFFKARTKLKVDSPRKAKQEPSHQHLLTYESFLDVLVDVSQDMYKNLDSPQKALGLLISNYLAANAKSWTYAPHEPLFQIHSEMIATGSMNKLKKQFRKPLYTFFVAYSTSHIFFSPLSTGNNASIDRTKEKNQLLDYKRFLAFANDFKLISLGVQTLRVSEIFLACCRQQLLRKEDKNGDFIQNKKFMSSNLESDDCSHKSNSSKISNCDDRLRTRIMFDGFVEALCRLSFLSLAEYNKHNLCGSPEAKAKHTLLNLGKSNITKQPEVAFKALLHHIYSNVLSSPRVVSELFRKVDLWGWSKGQQILAAAQSYNNQFEKMWRNDNFPKSYYEVAALSCPVNAGKTGTKLKRGSKARNILLDSCLSFEQNMVKVENETENSFVRNHEDIMYTPSENAERASIRNHSEHNFTDIPNEQPGLRTTTLSKQGESSRETAEVKGKSSDNDVACDQADSYFELASEACCCLVVRLCADVRNSNVAVSREEINVQTNEIEKVAQLCNSANMIYNSIVQREDGTKWREACARRNMAIQRLCNKFLSTCFGSSQGVRTVFASDWFISLWNDSEPKSFDSLLAASYLVKLFDMMHAYIEESCIELSHLLGINDRNDERRSQGFLYRSEEGLNGGQFEYSLGLQLASSLHRLCRLKVIGLRLRLMLLNNHPQENSNSGLRLIFHHALSYDSNYEKLEKLYARLQDSKEYERNHVGNFSHILFERAIAAVIVVVTSLLASVVPNNSKSDTRKAASILEQEADNPDVDTWVLTEKQIATARKRIKDYLLKARSISEKLYDEYEKNKSRYLQNREDYLIKRRRCESRIIMLWIWSSVIDIEKALTSHIRALTTTSTFLSSKQQTAKYEFLDFETGSGAEVLMNLKDKAGSLLTATAAKACSVLLRKLDRYRNGRLDVQEVLNLICKDREQSSHTGTEKVIDWFNHMGWLATSESSFDTETVQEGTCMTPTGFRSYFVWNVIVQPISITQILAKIGVLDYFATKPNKSTTIQIEKFGCSQETVTHLIRKVISPIEAGNPVEKDGSRRGLLMRSSKKMCKEMVDDLSKESNAHINNDSRDTAITVDDVSSNAKLVDYFIVIVPGEVKNGSDIGNVKDPEEVEFVPEIVSIWPPKPGSADASQLPTDAEQATIRMIHEQYPVPDDLPMFCFPYGAHVRVLPLSSPPQNYSFGFVLTNSTGLRRFGFCYIFYEEITMRNLASNIMRSNHTVPSWMCGGKPKNLDKGSDNTETSVFSPTCICVLSRWPFFNTFEVFLRQIYNISKSSPPYPLESYISSFVSNTPVPPRGNTQVQVALGDVGIYISRPPSNELPLKDVSFLPLFQRLSINNIILLVSALVQEKKIALCSSNIGLLTPIAETLCSLLFPFRLQCVYIPILPQALYDFLCSPVPFLMGVHSNYIETAETQVFASPIQGMNRSFSHSPMEQASENGNEEGVSSRIFVASNLYPDDVIFVDLDSDRLLISESNTTMAEIVGLPDIASKKLHNKLQKLCDKLKNQTLKSTANSNTSQEAAFNSVQKKKAINFRKVSFDKLATVEAREVHSNTNKSSAASRVPRSKQDVRILEWTSGVQSAFLDMFVSFLQNYRKYMRIKAPGKESSSAAEGDDGQSFNFDSFSAFDDTRFISDHPTYKKFYESLFATQLFDQFISAQKTRLQQTKTGSHSLPGEYDSKELQLFDNLIEMKRSNRKLPSLYTYGLPKKQKPTSLLGNPHGAITHTVYVVPTKPLNSSDGHDETVWQYNKFPVLHPGMMRSTKIPIEHLTDVKKVPINDILSKTIKEDITRPLADSCANFSAIIEAKSDSRRKFRKFSSQTSSKLSYALCESIVLSLVYEAELEALRKQLNIRNDVCSK